MRPIQSVDGWMIVAAIIGWILSRLPARKQKIYIRSSDPIKSEKRPGGGGLLRPLWNGGWAITKPPLAAYWTKNDCGKGEVPGRKFSRRGYQIGVCIFKRD
jgi:hypothetical protein